MDNNPYAPKLKSLPETLAVFPLTGVLLLPHGNLPLNIFEPRYLAMINDAMASSKMIGMIQSKGTSNAPKNELYSIGCAGKITEYAEMPDGNYVINLTGICRFHVTEELDTPRPYRIVNPNWKEFEHDVKVPESLGVDREKLMSLLCGYFRQNEMSCDFNKFENIPDNRLITTLAMVCPFSASEKQALLEQICHLERVKTFMTMLEMATTPKGSNDDTSSKHH